MRSSAVENVVVEVVVVDHVADQVNVDERDPQVM